MHLGDPQPMAGDADEAHEPLVACRGEGGDRTARTERDVPLVGLDEVVQLDQVDLVDVHPGERPLELGTGVGALAFAGLRGEEHLTPVVGEPRPQPNLGFAVPGRGIDVVDATRPDHLECRVGTILRHRSERGRAEDHPCGLVAGPAKGGEWKHETTVPQLARWDDARRSQGPSAPRSSRIRSARNDDAVRPLASTTSSAGCRNNGSDMRARWAASPVGLTTRCVVAG